MSAEQRDNNLGIDPELRNTDPLEYLRRLMEIRDRQEAGLIEYGAAFNWVFVVVEGPDLGQTVLLGEQPVSIGRGRDDSFQLRDVGVTHCQLVVEWDSARQHHWLHQTGDSHTVINGIPAARNAGVRHELEDGDQIQIGGTVLRYQGRRA